MRGMAALQVRHRGLAMALSSFAMTLALRTSKGALPVWPHSRRRGNGHRCDSGLVLRIGLVLLLLENL